MLNTITPRYKKFNEIYSRGDKSIAKSAIEAGFSEVYAKHQGDRILNTAIRLQTQQLLNRSTNKEITAQEAKTSMLDILGKSSQMLKDRLNKIAFEQDKDYSSALKILAPLSREAIGLDISQQEQPNITVPVLNIVVDKTDMASSKDIVEGEMLE